MKHPELRHLCQRDSEWGVCLNWHINVPEYCQTHKKSNTVVQMSETQTRNDHALNISTVPAVIPCSPTQSCTWHSHAGCLRY